MKISQQCHGHVQNEGCWQEAWAADPFVFLANRGGIAEIGSPSCVLMEDSVAGRLACQRDGVSVRSGESPAKIRWRKVRAVRRQLARGRYDITIRLAAIFDRVLEDLTDSVNKKR